MYKFFMSTEISPGECNAHLWILLCCEEHYVTCHFTREQFFGDTCLPFASFFLAQLLFSEQINSDAMIDDFHLEGSGNKTMQVETPALI